MSWLPTFSLLLLASILTVLLISGAYCEDKSQDEKKTNEAEKWKKKDVRDYSEADLERLFEQWEDADEDELEPDELPEWKREPPKMDMSKIDTSNPESMLKMSKKGRTLMLFATVSENPSQAETEKVTQIWQGSLFNANMETQRYVVSDNRVIFMLKDGAMAWDIKNFLVEQERCEEVTIEGKSYPGKGAGKGTKEEKVKKAKDKRDSKKSDKSDSMKDKKKDAKVKTEL